MGGKISRDHRRIGRELPAPSLEMREIGPIGPASVAGNAVLDESGDTLGELFCAINCMRLPAWNSQHSGRRQPVDPSQTSIKVK
jgi:hypothetical protein